MTPAPPGPEINDLLRVATHDLHGVAERSGFIAMMLKGRVTIPAYALFLRNLLPAYRAMEVGLESHGGSGLRHLALPQVYRAPALEADLRVLAGANWETEVPVLAAGAAYGEAVTAAAGGGALIGHAYARTLGDLSGGRVLRRLLGRMPDMPAEALAFYAFPDIADLDAFRTLYREAIARAAQAFGDPTPILEAATEAFRFNIRVSEAVQTAATA